MSRSLVGSLVVLVAVLAFAPAAARAADCTTLSVDGVTAQDPYGASAEATEGLARVGQPNLDAFRTAQVRQAPPPDGSCTLENGDREIAFAPRRIAGSEVGFKVYVPITGAFVRTLISVRNPSATDSTTFDVWDHASFDWGAGVAVAETSSGDKLLRTGDDWFVGSDKAGLSTTHVVRVLQGEDVRRREAADALTSGVPLDPFDDGDKDLVASFEDFVLAPGETKTFMALSAVAPDEATAVAAAGDLAGAPAGVFTAMTADEIRSVQNFVAPDADRDGVANETDNCLYVVNADQLNRDRDVEGDACDADDDNDGLTDELETIFRTDPIVADSDGDGVNDRNDPCPTVKGTGGTDGNGCPGRVIGRVKVQDVTARLTPARDRRAPFRFKISGLVVPPDGLSVRRACRSRGWVSIVYKRGRKTVSSRRTRINRNCTFSQRKSFASRKRLGRRTTALRVTVRWTGNAYLSPKGAGTFRAAIR